MAETTNHETVPCTRCGVGEADAPLNIHEDPLCLSCLRVLIEEAATKAFHDDRRREQTKEPKICIHPVCQNVVTAGTSDYCTPCLQEFVRIQY